MIIRRPPTSGQIELSFNRRSLLIGGAQGTIGVLLAARMGYISVFENRRYRLMAESNRVNLTLVPPRRGWFIDRNGKPMATNRADFRVDIIPDRLVDKDATVKRLAELLALAPDDVDRIHREIATAQGFQPVQVAENLDFEAYSRVSVRLPELPGVSPRQGFSRYYPTGATVGHLLGYVGAVSAEEYQKNKDPLLITPGFKIGKEALERSFEPTLRGTAGAKRVEVTAGGKIVRELASRLDVPGKPVQLTIDLDLHDYAARRIGGQSGSIVVIDCETGDILAMASMPSYDPNRFSDGISRSEWAMFSKNDHLPLVNKSIHGLYPPGSTTKPMASLAFLKAGIDPEATAHCSGAYSVGGTIFHCSVRRGHGAISMREAIIKSCDIYYYHFARSIGMDILAPTAKLMGFGEKFDLPFGSQRYGTYPDPAWYQKKYKKVWTIGDTINTSIGQGYVLANPLQLAMQTARIASGKLLMPRLWTGQKKVAPPSLGLNEEHLKLVREAMSGVVNSGRGTASVARLPIPGVTMAGKTGTAQVRRITDKQRNFDTWKWKDHSLFIGFAPAEAPKYAVGCIIEHGGFGASAAAPMVRDTMTYLFDREKGMAILRGLEASWGGDLETRMDAQRTAWAAQNSATAANPDPPKNGSSGER